MYELIAKLTLIGSTCGMGLILFRKIPALVLLPEYPEEPFSLKGLPFEFKEKIKDLGFVKSFSSEKFLQKLLLKFKFLALKTDKLTSKWIITLRSRSIERKNNLSNNYWDEVKKERSTKKEKKIIVK